MTTIKEKIMLNVKGKEKSVEIEYFEGRNLGWIISGEKLSYRFRTGNKKHIGTGVVKSSINDKWEARKMDVFHNHHAFLIGWKEDSILNDSKW